MAKVVIAAVGSLGDTAPLIAIGASGEHADFPGTLSIGHVALSTLLVELGRHASLHWAAASARSRSTAMMCRDCCWRSNAARW